MKNKRLKPEVRKEDILRTALPLAEKLGYTKVSRETITDSIGITGPALNYHFGTMTQFRRELLRYAIKNESLLVIAQALSSKVHCVQKAPKELQRRALESLL